MSIKNLFCYIFLLMDTLGKNGRRMTSHRDREAGMDLFQTFVSEINVNFIFPL